MSSELNDKKVVIDSREVASKLSFLVGRTILFREGRDDSCTATQVVAINAANILDSNGYYACVCIYTSIGTEKVVDSNEFNNIMVLEPDGTLTCLGNYTDNMGICF